MIVWVAGCDCDFYVNQFVSVFCVILDNGENNSNNNN